MAANSRPQPIAVLHGVRLYECPQFHARISEKACKDNRRLAKRQKQNRAPTKGDSLTGFGGFMESVVVDRENRCRGCPGVVKLAQGAEIQQIEEPATNAIPIPTKPMHQREPDDIVHQVSDLYYVQGHTIQQLVVMTGFRTGKLHQIVYRLDAYKDIPFSPEVQAIRAAGGKLRINNGGPQYSRTKREPDEVVHRITRAFYIERKTLDYLVANEQMGIDKLRQILYRKRTYRDIPYEPEAEEARAALLKSKPAPKPKSPPQNKYGYPGVFYEKRSKKFRGRIRVNKREYNAGLHPTPEAAFHALEEKKARLRKMGLL